MFIAFGLALSLALKYTVQWSFSLTGMWIGCIGFLVFGLSWASPDPIVAWAGTGLDNHPERNGEVLLPDECKNYPLWKQPNRLRRMIAAAIVFTGALLQAVGQTVGM